VGLCIIHHNNNNEDYTNVTAVKMEVEKIDPLLLNKSVSHKNMGDFARRHPIWQIEEEKKKRHAHLEITNLTLLRSARELKRAKIIIKECFSLSKKTNTNKGSG